MPPPRGGSPPQGQPLQIQRTAKTADPRVHAKWRCRTRAGSTDNRAKKRPWAELLPPRLQCVCAVLPEGATEAESVGLPEILPRLTAAERCVTSVPAGQTRSVFLWCFLESVDFVGKGRHKKSLGHRIVDSLVGNTLGEGEERDLISGFRVELHKPASVRSLVNRATNNYGCRKYPRACIPSPFLFECLETDTI